MEGNKKAGFLCRAPQSQGGEQFFEDLESAQRFALENSRYGCVVTDGQGAPLYQPIDPFAADFLYQAKQVCDYIRDQGFQYGDAPVNPAVNCDARLVSCDRMVGWALYRLGHIDQPKVQGLCVSGPGMTNWCIEHNFQRVDRVEELLPGDIVFTRLNRFGCPAHTFIHAGKGEQEGMYYRYDAGKIERIRSTQPSCEPIENFLYAYRPAAPRDPVTPNLSFLYDGVPFDQLEKKEEKTGDGVRYTLPDGLQLECRVRRFPQQRVIWWTNWWYNPTSHESGLITQLWDCDVTLPMAPDPQRVRRDRQSTWEPSTAQLYVTNGANVKDDDNLAVPVRLWEGDRYTARCENGRSGMGTAPFFDFNRQEAGVLLAIGWTGQWHAVFDRDHASVRMRSGIEHAAFRVRPGERFRTGSAAVTTYWRGQDEAHNRWRRFMGEISPLGGKGRGEQAPFSGIFWGGVPSDRLMARWEKLLDAGLPLDTCWIDAGWYEPLRAENCSGQSAEWPNVGIWEVNKKYHPDGYQDVIRFLRQRHVNFMVWMEPERVRRSVKEWAKTLPGPDPALDDLLIALNDDSVADQVIELVSSKIEELHLSCYRQDYNILPLEYWLHNDQPERAGMTEIKYINNLYRFWDALLERFPHLLIDNCAGGGHRNDLEMLSRAVPLWRSDYQCTWDCCPEANQVQNAGAAWWYPYSGIGFGPTLGDLYSWRSAYTNGLAVRTWEHADPEWEVGAMGEPMDWAKRYFEEFSSVRHYFTKDYYPLIPQSMENLSWAASQYHDPSEGSGVILAFRRAKSPHDRALVVLGGLNRHMDYQFTDADTGETFLLPGLALVTEGMALSIPNRRQSLLLRYQALRPSRQEPEAPC